MIEYPQGAVQAVWGVPVVWMARPEPLRWAWSSINSRDARASGLKRAIRCHVYITSDRTACAEPLLLSESDDRLLRMECFDDRSVELVRLADVPGPDPFSEGQLLGLELATEL